MFHLKFKNIFFTLFIFQYYFYLSPFFQESFANDLKNIEVEEVVLESDFGSGEEDEGVSCLITFKGEKTYYSDNVSVEELLEKMILSSNCDKSLTKKVMEKLISLNGQYDQDYLNLIFHEEFSKQRVLLVPKRGILMNLGEWLKGVVSCFKGRNLRQSKFINKDQVLILGEENELNVKSDLLCKVDSLGTTKQLGEKNILLQINSMIGSNKIEQKRIFATTILKERIKVLRSIKNISIQNSGTLNNGAQTGSELDNSFQEDYLETENPELYFQKTDSIRFFKLNKNLQENNFLKYSDLVPQIIVQQGMPIKVRIVDQKMVLTTSGVSKKSGKIGDDIEVINSKSKKSYMAKIVDYNTVEMKL